jgi:hypothetical protein
MDSIPSALKPPIGAPNIVEPNIVELGRNTRFTSERMKAMWEDRRAKLNPPPPIAEPITPFAREQRDAIRRQLTRLDGLMSDTTDPRDLDRLAAAWAKLAEQERILDGRPLPGSRRPVEVKPKQSFPGPLE